MKNLLFFSLIFGFWGCQHTKIRLYKVYNNAAKGYYRDCAKLSGETEVTYKKGKRTILQTPVDWLSRKKGDFEMEAIDPFGQTLFSLKIKGKRAKSYLMRRSSKNFVSLNDHQFINIDGYDAGIKSEELSCIMSGSLPRKWLYQEAIEISSEEVKYRIHEEERRITITLENKYKHNFPKICCRVEKKFLLFFNRTVFSWCTDKYLQKSEITLPDKSKILLKHQQSSFY